MTLSKLFTLSLAAFVAFTTANLNAQQSYSSSWSNQSSWNSSWSTGPNGTHVSGNQQSSQQSSTTVTNGNRTQQFEQNHNQSSGFARGLDSNGAYNTQYANQNGNVTYIDQTRHAGSLGTVTNTRAVQGSYNNSQGFTETLGANGYTINGYNNRQAGIVTLNDTRGNILGTNFGQGRVRAIGYRQNQSFNGGINQFGQPSLNLNQSTHTFQGGRDYGWRN